MNKAVEKIARDKILEKIIKNVARQPDDDLEDLKQDLLLYLLELDEDFLWEMIYNGQINYYLTRIVLNNVNSSTSRYYYNYKKHKNNTISINSDEAQGIEDRSVCDGD